MDSALQSTKAYSARLTYSYRVRFTKLGKVHNYVVSDCKIVFCEHNFQLLSMKLAMKFLWTRKQISSLVYSLAYLIWKFNPFCVKWRISAWNDIFEGWFFILNRQEDSDLYRSGMNCRQPVRAAGQPHKTTWKNCIFCIKISMIFSC